MNAARARRARRLALDALAYRSWAEAPATAAIPAASVVSDPRIHRHEARRASRLAGDATRFSMTSGRLATPAPTLASA